MASDSARDHTESSHHVVAPRVYITIFIALLILTAVTIGVAAVDLGALNTPVAIGIAVLKATLVLMFFMNVRHSSPLLRVFVAAGFIWFAIMIAFTMSDFISRDWAGAATPRIIAPAVTDLPDVPTTSPTSPANLPTQNPNRAPTQQPGGGPQLSGTEGPTTDTEGSGSP